jgi:hypothetical protein
LLALCSGFADWLRAPFEIISKVALVSIVLNVILGLSSSGVLKNVLQGIFPMINDVRVVLYWLVISIIGVGFQIVIVYFPLKALAYILRILAEMEFNSRKT